jgi:hypothetical protein
MTKCSLVRLSGVVAVTLSLAVSLIGIPYGSFSSQHRDNQSVVQKTLPNATVQNSTKSYTNVTANAENKAGHATVYNAGLTIETNATTNGTDQPTRMSQNGLNDTSSTSNINERNDSNNTAFDYDKFWQEAFTVALANNKSLTRWEQQRDNRPCPKVYVYNLSDKFMAPKSLSMDLAYGRAYGMEGHLRDTHQYSFAQILLYRLNHSPSSLPSSSLSSSCMTHNPNEAELFYVPIHPWIMGYSAWQQACDTMKVSEILQELPYLTPQTACRHFFVLSKGHYVAYNCTGWWSDPVLLLQNAMRVAYSHVEYERRPNGGTQSFLRRIPNLFSVPYPSNVHWTGATATTAAATTSLKPPWTRDFVENGGRETNHHTTIATATTLTSGDTTTPDGIILMSYIGSSSHGIDIEARQMIKTVCQGYNNPLICRTNKMVASRHESINIKKKSIFCLEPVGDSPWRKGIADSVSFGCIPILLSNVTDMVADWSWNHWKRQGRILIPRDDFVEGRLDLYTLLTSIPSQLLELMQVTLARYGRQFQYSLDEDTNDGIHMTLMGLRRQAESMEQAGKCQ